MRAQLPSNRTVWEFPGRLDPTVYIAVGAAFAISFVVVYAPILALPALGLAASVLLLSLGATLPKVFIGALAALLIGYAFLGRGLAHVGAPPIYLGEMVLGLGVLSFVSRLGRVSFGPLEWLLIAFMLWGAARTLPFYSEYGQDAPRDAVLWGYSLFALAIPVALGNRDKTDTVMRLYQNVLPFFLLWVPVVALAAGGIEFPNGPGSEVGIVQFKGGDMGVHLGGAAAFLLLGLYSSSFGFRVPLTFIWLAWFLGFAVAGGLNRGGLVAAGLSLIAAFVLRPTMRVVQVGAIVGLIVLLAAITNFRIDIGDSGKHISVSEMSRRLSSVFGSDDEALEGTKNFRQEWWGDIVSYTFTGPYFWGGKGFGINLANSDGYQVTEDESHRAPHNSHVTVLARMGVPGLAMWIAFQAGFAGSLLVAMRRAHRAGLAKWVTINGWLLVYWLAICINTSFDPYLEGPQGGIWYWSLVGFGLYALRLQDTEIRQATSFARETAVRRRRSPSQTASNRRPRRSAVGSS